MLWLINATVKVQTDTRLITQEVPPFNIWAASEDDAREIAYAIILTAHNIVADKNYIENLAYVDMKVGEL